MPPPASPLAFSIHALRLAALDALCASDIHSKQAALQDCVLALSAAENANAATAATTQTEGLDSGHIPEPLHLPGRPARPELRPHRDISTASLHTPEGLPRLLHSIAHIEFNAINLALDAVWRFAAMPLAFYADWLQVAHEEAYHFKLLQDLLLELGYAYGDFPAHTGLWEMTEKTKADITARMALVPRTLEARGLDATPPMQARLRKLGTPVALKAVAVLDIILRDEVGHVRIGNHWYGWLCARQGLDPVAHYQVLTEQYQAPRLRAPFNEAARLAAGFSAVELAALQEVALQKPSTIAP